MEERLKIFNSLKKYLLSTNNVPGTVPGSEQDTVPGLSS